MLLRRSLLAAAVGVMVPFITCQGQNPATFTTVTSASGTIPETLYAMDVNNDGSPDLIQTTQQAPIEFTVSLSKGNGSFDAPVPYAFPSGLASSPQLAFGDFTGNGKVDIVAAFKNEIAMYLGNGNGTFAAAKIQSNVLPSGYSFQNVAPVAADFNHDGKIDLVAIAYNTSGINSAVVLEGDGNGTFTYKGDVYNVPSGDSVSELAGGDFDADNNADVAIGTNASCDNGAASCYGTVHVLYGNGDFGFTETTPYSSNSDAGGLSIYSGDLNGDGRTDLFGYLGTGQLVLLYGQSNRTFTSYFYSDVPSGGVTSLSMADFNGDGHMDVVGFDFTDEPGTGPTFQLAIFLSTGAEGGFKTQLYTLPYLQTETNVVVGDFNKDTKPDIAIVQNPAPSGTGSSSVAAVINTTSSGNWGGCAYPKTGQGISLCTPAPSSSDASPVTFKASANSYGDIRKFELWVDGKKISEQHNNWGNYGYFDLSSAFAAGTHSATLNVTTIDNDAMDYNFKFTVPAAQ
jgi:hypothetical protein